MAPIIKNTGGSAGKGGVSLSGKGLIGGRSGSSGSKLSSLAPTGNKSNFGSTASKTSNFGSTASKSSNFGSTASKTSNFDSTASKMSTFGSQASKVNTTLGSTQSKASGTYGSLYPVKDKSSNRTPSFFGGQSAKISSGLTPSTSRKAYDLPAYGNHKREKASTFGIIWIPGRKRNRKKDQAFNAINYDKRNERTPTMYNVMSGDSPDYQGHKKREEESALLVPEKFKGPIATVASAGTTSAIAELPSVSPVMPDTEDKLLNNDEETKEAAGDATNKEDTEYLDNDGGDKADSNTEKTSDKVDSVFVSPPSAVKSPPPQSVTSNPDDDDCVVKCLYYTLQCCDCVLM